MGNGLHSLILWSTVAAVSILSSLALNTSLVYALEANGSGAIVSNETGSLNAKGNSMPVINTSVIQQILNAVNNTDTKNITIQHILNAVNNTDTKNITIQQILNAVNNTDTKNATMQYILESLNKTANSSQNPSNTSSTEQQ